MSKCASSRLPPGVLAAAALAMAGPWPALASEPQLPFPQNVTYAADSLTPGSGP